MLKIKFGTDGWRAIIAQEFTVENVARVADATAQFLLNNIEQPKIIIGHDCRFGGELFVETAIKVFCQNNIKVICHKNFVSTPMISYAVLKHQCHQGIVITASHNPPSYNGYKLKGAHGGPSSPDDIQTVEDLIKDEPIEIVGTIEEYENQGLIQYIDIEKEYIDYLKEKFDINSLNNSPFKMAYDAMFGAGQKVMQELFPQAVFLHCERNPLFNNTPPEPLHKNLLLLSETMAKNSELKYGLANDGDADRIAIYDENGKYIDSHHVILLLIQYLHKYKNLNGKVAIAASTSLRVNKMCEKYGLECEVTPVGFKHISMIMMNEDVLVGGEESGGISVKGHIPERDGIYDGILLYEFMQKTGKKVSELIAEIYEVVGAFHYERNDLHITNELKQKAIDKCKNGIKSFGKYEVLLENTIDGFKYTLPNDCWTMVRASGTEPLLRIYAEGNTEEDCNDILKTVEAYLFS